MSNRDQAFLAYRERAINAMLDRGDAMILRAGGVLSRSDRRKRSPKIPTTTRHWVLESVDHMRLRWDKARPHLDIRLDYHHWALQLAELQKALRWPSDYEPPPASSLLDTAALVNAPRPGPSVGMPCAA